FGSQEARPRAGLNELTALASGTLGCHHQHSTLFQALQDRAQRSIIGLEAIDPHGIQLADKPAKDCVLAVLLSHHHHHIAPVQNVIDQRCVQTPHMVGSNDIGPGGRDPVHSHDSYSGDEAKQQVNESTRKSTAHLWTSTEEIPHGARDCLAVCIHEPQLQTHQFPIRTVSYSVFHL